MAIEEQAQAIRSSQSTVKRRIRHGYKAHEVILIARYFGLKPLDVLVDLGFLTLEEAEMPTMRPFKDSEICEEITRRVKEREARDETD